MAKKDVSLSVIRRLPRYFRLLASLKKSGIVRISSNEFSEKLGLSASQVRQDLNYFGGFGQQGYGYNVNNLYVEIGNILSVNSGMKTVLIGAGNLGRSIIKNLDSHSKNLELIGIFDKNTALVGEMISDLVVRNAQDLDDFCKEHRPLVAIVCIPNDNTKEVFSILAKNGVKGFWNFTDYNPKDDFPDVVVENVHLTDSMMTMCYRINNETDIR